LLIGILAVVLGGCGMDVAPNDNPTPQSTLPPEPTATPLAFLPDLNADEVKEVLIETLDATCRDGDGTEQRMWTCSIGTEVAISAYGPSPAEVSAFRVVTEAGREVDRRSWLRGYASLISVEVFEWVYDHFGSHETAYVDGVWVHMSHDATSDGVLISTEEVGP
jgi:hypothetical protein